MWEATGVKRGTVEKWGDTEVGEEYQSAALTGNVNLKRHEVSSMHPLFFSAWGGILTNRTFHSATSLYSASAILEYHLHVGGAVRNLKLPWYHMALHVMVLY